MAEKRPRRRPLDADAIERLRQAADMAWAEAAKHMEEYNRAAARANSVTSPTHRETLLKAAKAARDSAARWLRPFRKLVAAIEKHEEP